MDNIQLRKKIESLKPWYQKIRFNDEVTNESDHSKWSGEVAWKYVKMLLPKDLPGMRILDLGSNAGLFSVRTALLDAGGVLGVESDRHSLEQAEFVKSYFEEQTGRKLPIRYIYGKVEDISKMKLGYFDLVLAISILYHLGRKSTEPHYSEGNRAREIRFLHYLTTITDRVIVRGRNKRFNNADYYINIFSDFGFRCERKIDEEESQRVTFSLIRKG